MKNIQIFSQNYNSGTVLAYIMSEFKNYNYVQHY